MKRVFAGLTVVALALPALALGEPAAAPEAPVSFVLGTGQARAVPALQGSAHTGGGNIHVTQPSPDTLSVVMTGVTVARGHPLKDSAARLDFDLSQHFEVAFHSPKVKKARLVMWGRVIGLLRSECCCKGGGSAEVSAPAHASVCLGPAQLLELTVPAHAVGCGENASVYDRVGPVWVPVGPGDYTLRQTFGLAASHRKGLCCRPVSAEFAPEPAFKDEWAGRREPFHGAAKKDFGFHVILKVVAEENGDAAKNGK